MGQVRGRLTGRDGRLAGGAPRLTDADDKRKVEERFRAGAEAFFRQAGSPSIGMRSDAPFRLERVTLEGAYPDTQLVIWATRRDGVVDDFRESIWEYESAYFDPANPEADDYLLLWVDYQEWWLKRPLPWPPVSLDDALAGCDAFAAPRRPDGEPFRLVCRFGESAAPSEIEDAGRAAPLPPGIAELWQRHQEAELFRDVDYGQWGLRLLSPGASARRTEQARTQRPGEFHRRDLVVGDFLGDQELVVLDQYGSVLIATPLDSRTEWSRASGHLNDFLARFVAATGNKYWEG